jgi:hypothetical protein
MELNLYPFPIDTFHIAGFLGQDISVMKMDAVTLIYAMLGHG